MSLSGTAPSIPISIQILLDFANTLDLQLGTDRIAVPEGLKAWLESHEINSPEIATSEPVGLMQDLREAIRELIISKTGSAIDPAASVIIAECWRRAEIGLVIGREGQLSLVPEGNAVTEAFGALTAHLLWATSREQHWHRLKACENPLCQRVFYDHSRNRSARWCAMASCGNRSKVRTYRLRQRRARQLSPGSTPPAADEET